MDLRPDAAVQLLRIVKEALSKVHRHAGASRVSVHLLREDGLLELKIADDGRGFGGPVYRGTSPGRGSVVSVWILVSWSV